MSARDTGNQHADFKAPESTDGRSPAFAFSYDFGEHSKIMTIKEEPKEVSSADRITGYQEFLDGLESADRIENLKTNWNIFKRPNGVGFYHLESDENFSDMMFSFKILINGDLRVKVFDSKGEADSTELNWVLKNSKLELWSQFHNMLDYYQTEPRIQPTCNQSHHIKQALESLNKIESPFDTDFLLDPIKYQLSSMLCQTNPLDVSTEPDDAKELLVGLKPEVILDEVKSEFEENDDSSINDDYEEKPRIRKRKKTRSGDDASPKKAKSDKKKSGPKPRPKVEGEVFKCKHCDKISETKLGLKSHYYRMHSGSFCCELCGKVLTSKHLLKDHMMRHDENSRVKCPHCDDRMLPESMSRHIRVRHEGYKPFPCSICGKCFSNTFLRREHEKIHNKHVPANGEKILEGIKLVFECQKCTKRFERGGKVFEAHVSRCHGILIEKRRSYRYPCPECNKNFITKIAAADHMLEIHKIQIGNVERFCFICKAEFEDARTHARSHHCNFQCPQCGLQFMSQTKLDNHIANHETGEDRPHVCDLCPMKFKISNHLQSHKKTVHVTDNEKKFVCNVCNKRFAFQYMLTSHFQQNHSDVKRYACTFCGMKFKILNAMKNHCKIDHGEENAYRCPDCSETLKTLNDLKNHRQNVHGTSMNAQKYHETQSCEEV